MEDTTDIDTEYTLKGSDYVFSAVYRNGVGVVWVGITTCIPGSKRIPLEATVLLTVTWYKAITLMINFQWLIVILQIVLAVLRHTGHYKYLQISFSPLLILRQNYKSTRSNCDHLVIIFALSLFLEAKLESEPVKLRPFCKYFSS